MIPFRVITCIALSVFALSLVFVKKSVVAQAMLITSSMVLVILGVVYLLLGPW